MPANKVRHVEPSPKELAEDPLDHLDLSKLAPVVGRGIFADEARGERPLKVAYVVVDEMSVTYSLEDGRKVSAPLAWYPRLQHATPAERNDWRLILGGRAASWRSLKMAVSAKALLEGAKANESPASLRKWLTERSKTRRQQKKAG